MILTAARVLPFLPTNTRASLNQLYRKTRAKCIAPPEHSNPPPHIILRIAFSLPRLPDPAHSAAILAPSGTNCHFGTSAKLAPANKPGAGDIFSAARTGHLLDFSTPSPRPARYNSVGLHKCSQLFDARRQLMQMCVGLRTSSFIESRGSFVATNWQRCSLCSIFLSHFSMMLLLHRRSHPAALVS